MRNNKMYESERKEQFLSENSITGSMERIFRNAFELIAPLEEQKNADVCTWDEAELKKLLEFLSGFRSYSSDNRAKLLRRYVRWCIDKGVPGAGDAIFGIKAAGYSKVREMTLSGPEHLQKILDTLFDPVSSVTSDNIMRGYCWLAFSGLSDQEIVDLRSSDVDLENFCVVFGGDSFPLCQQSIPCMRILREMGAFRYYHPGYDNDFIWRPRMDGEKLLRGIRAAEPSVLHLRSMLSKAVNASYKSGKIDVKISHYRIWISGEFYRMFLRERAGEEIDFSHLAERSFKLREEKGDPYKLDSGNNRKTAAGKKREIESAYREDYQRWKFAYSV